MAERCSALPVSLPLRARLANITIPPIITWGGLLNGKTPTKAERDRFHSIFRTAVKGHSPGDHADRNLQDFFLVGHQSDLALTLASRTLRAFGRFARFNGLQDGPSLEATRKLVDNDC